jgi:hypothetical protein
MDKVSDFIIERETDTMLSLKSSGTLWVDILKLTVLIVNSLKTII